MMRTFTLLRHVDVSNVSGTGPVAQGCVFDNGTVALHWPSSMSSTAVYKSIDDVIAIHCHGDKSEILWHDQTVLARIGELVAGGLEFTRIKQMGFGPERWVEVATGTDRENWLTWLHALSAAAHPEDAAVLVDWDGDGYYDSQHRWMDSSGNVLVTFLERES